MEFCIITVYLEEIGVFKAALSIVIGMGFIPNARLFALIIQTVGVFDTPGRLIGPLAFCLACGFRTIPLAAFGSRIRLKQFSAPAASLLSCF